MVRRQTRAEVRDALDPLLRAGEVATCGIVDLEALYSASSPTVYGATAAALGELPKAAVDEECVARALEIQALLAERSQHRGVSVPDLLVAACAERAGLILLHYDSDFDRIAGLTGQAARWIVPRASVS